MKNTLAIFVVCLFGVLSFTENSRGAVVINFDDLTRGTSLDTGDVVTTQYQSLGVTFVNPDFFSRANQSISGLFPGHSNPNLLFIRQRDDFGNIHGRPEEIIFSRPVTQASFLFETSYEGWLTVTAFSPQGSILETMKIQGFVNDPLHLLPKVGMVNLNDPSGIGRIELYTRTFQNQGIADPSANFGIDDLTFTPVPAPEASSIIVWSLLAIGLIAARRRRS